MSLQGPLTPPLPPPPPLVPPPPLAQAPAGSPGWPPAQELVSAGLGRRLAAFLLDGLFIGIFTLVGLMVAGELLRTAAHGAAEITPEIESSAGVLLTQLLTLAILVGGTFVYPAIAWRRGATLAMRILGLRVVDARTGDRLTWGQVLLRSAGWWWSLVTLGAGFAIALTERRRRSLPDRMASSLVLSARALPLTWLAGPQGWILWPSRPAFPPPLDPQARPAAEAAPPRSRWSWTDVAPVLILLLPIILGANWVAVVTARGLGITAGSGGGIALSLGEDIAVYGATLLLIAVLVRWRRHTSLGALGLRLPSWPWLVAGLPMGFAALVLQDAGGLLSRAILPTASSTNQCVGIRSSYGGSWGLTLLAVAIIAPVAEEIIFRGFTFRYLQGRLPLWLAVVVSAILFSAAHAAWAEPALFIPVFLGGLLLAYLYAKSGSVWPGVIAHMTINAVGVAVLLASSGC
ncbi:MAG TPA: CPBP family glutamic-type intramembrane protease [Candidatus Binatia bacterium]|nr:CPBP family glutamic-type intramembrane protease [Candidatus Binatia bacterium]